MSSFLHKSLTILLLMITIVLLCGFVEISIRFEDLETAHLKAIEELKKNTIHKIIEIPIIAPEPYEEPEEFDFSKPI